MYTNYIANAVKLYHVSYRDQFLTQHVIIVNVLYTLFRRIAKAQQTQLFNALEDADIISYRSATHVENTTQPCVLDLKIAGGAGELHGS